MPSPGSAAGAVTTDHSLSLSLQSSTKVVLSRAPNLGDHTFRPKNLAQGAKDI
jgi:hypothetical protein